ncbi:NAD(P)/FAD-dependent oxidoreductase [Hoeflea sp. TYP-13]|uniref:NAD(P)/FAD-dependent oxidoreductase n=1 Tax=Hoeflea sp. TYP-13 TaxID=3230023 RepID=UPI0034C6D243
MNTVDVVIIGAGPAGMAAASQAADFGASVVLLDEQCGPGGQIYRSITGIDPQREKILGKDYSKGRALAGALQHDNIRYTGRVTVWRVDGDGTVTYSKGEKSTRIKGRQIIIATGALERPVPLPGWTLPGVITAGAAQILLKSTGLVADNAVLVGSGPLLYLLAAQMIAAGTAPAAMIETQSLKSHLSACAHLGGAIRGWRMLAKGVRLLGEIRRAGVPRYRAAQAIRIAGTEKSKTVSFRSGGKDRSVACTTVLLHQGVVPNTQISRSLGLDHDWNAAQRCFHPRTDQWGETTNSIFNIAGDGAGIAGASAAEYAGRLAACNVAFKLGLIVKSRRDELAAPIFKQLASERAARPFLDTLYMPPEEILRPADDTLVCRCEEVRAGDIRRYARIGCVGPNQTKAYGRCGMGPCQGRYCGATVTEILAAENELPPDEIGSYRIRSPLKPVTLQELASLCDTTAD